MELLRRLSSAALLNEKGFEALFHCSLVLLPAHTFYRGATIDYQQLNNFPNGHHQSSSSSKPTSSNPSSGSCIRS